MLDGAHTAQAVTIEQGLAQTRHDWLAEEVPVAFVFNGISHAVMMASPLDLEDFALGFALTEGLIDHAGELLDTETRHTQQGIELQLQVTAACMHRLKERRRNLAGRTGCGLCGTDSLAQVQRALPRCPAVAVSAQAVTRAQKNLQTLQILQQYTGATHATAWCDLQGRVIALREDVGRHNALDKLIGHLVHHRTPLDRGFALITSRASFEMVQKAAMAGMGLLAAVSAPTELAVETAQSCGLALAGFVRGERLVAYTHAERFTHGH
jgi:FdhD protein